MPNSDEVRVSPRYREYVKFLNLSIRLRHVIGQPKHPIFAKTLFGIRYPALSARALFHVLRRHKLDNGPRAEDGPTVTHRLGSNIESIRRAVAVAQYKNAVFNFMEKELYRDSFLGAGAYIRLELHPTENWFSRKNDGSERLSGDFTEGVVANAQLLIHRSGVMQLLFMIPLPDSLTASPLVWHAHAGNPMFSAAEYPEVLLKLASKTTHASETDWIGHWTEARNEGQRWRRMEFAKPASVVDLYNMYYDAIRAATKPRLNPGWLCYPTLFIDEITCCASRDAWMGKHAKELYQVVGRIANDGLRSEVIRAQAPSDSSLVDDDSVFMNMGMSTVVNWRRKSPEEFSQRLQRYLLIESCLLRYWQLVVLHTRLGVTLRRRRPDIRRIQVGAIEGMQEWRESAITYGSAAEVADKFLKELGVDRLHERLGESLDQLGQLLEAQDSKREAARSIVLAMAVVLATVLLGLPSISALLTIASSTNTGSFAGWFIQPLRAVAHHGASGAWALFLSLIAAVILMFTFTFWLSRNSYPRERETKKRGPGIRWPGGTITIKRASEGAAAEKTGASKPE